MSTNATSAYKMVLRGGLEPPVWYSGLLIGPVESNHVVTLSPKTAAVAAEPT